MNSGRVPALELCNVCKTFGGLKATDNISIEVKEHEIYGIIGPNGAGKTTLFNLITGVVPLSSGQIKVFGQDIIVNSVMQTIKKINEQGITILLVEQNAKKALAIANKACVLEQGKIIQTGTGQELLNDSKIIEAYLGGTKNTSK